MNQVAFRLILESDFRGGRYLPGRPMLRLTLSDRITTRFLAELLMDARLGGSKGDG